MKKLLLLCIATVMCTWLFSQTWIPGGLISGTWTLAGSPYLIGGTTQVPDGSTLTIEPGVTVEWQGCYAMHIQGRILAVGTEQDSILFMAADTSLGFGSIRFLYTPQGNDTSRFTYCIFRHGKVSEPFPNNSGGALGSIDFGKIAVDHCLFEYNKATEFNLDYAGGGAIALWNCNPVIRNSIFRENRSYGGGAIVCYGGAGALIQNNLFLGNTADYGGAIICRLGSNPEISTNTFRNNVAICGGAIEVMQNCSTVIDHNLFTGNRAEYGGAIDVDLDCSVGLTNNTIVNNMAGLDGGGLYIGSNCYAEVRNTIQWGNEALFGNQVYIVNGDGSGFYYSDVEGGMDSIGGNWHSVTWEECLDEDPMFADTLNYYLDGSSPCVDAGDPDEAYNDYEDPGYPGYALWPSMGSLTNDMGAYGGPYRGIITSLEEPMIPGFDGRPETHLLCYPNPAGGIVNCQLSVFEIQRVTLRIYDLFGREVRTLIDEKKSPGEYTVRMDVADLPSGVYLVRLQAGELSVVRKLIVK
jgi:hypothetical protein